MQDSDVWVEVSRLRSSLPASAHAAPDCRGHLHQFSGGAWVRQLLVLMDGCLYIYSDIAPDSPAQGGMINDGLDYLELNNLKQNCMQV